MTAAKLCCSSATMVEIMCRLRRFLQKHTRRICVHMKAVAGERKSSVARGTLPNAVTLALGANLRRYRELAGLTQVELAFDAEVERSRISKIERGHVNPSLLTLASICYCLKITLPVLFEGLHETLPPSWKGGTLRRSNQAVLDAPLIKRRAQG